MIANRLLVHWPFGWYEVTDTRGLTDPAMFANPGTPEWGGFDAELWLDAPVIQEAMLALGSSEQPDGMVRLAREQLAIFADPRTEIGTDLAPVDETDTPYLAFRVGDKVTVPDIDGNPVSERVIAITVTEDQDGVVTYAPDLKDLVLTDQERWQNNLDKMANGSIAGLSDAASPVSKYAGMGRALSLPQSEWTVTAASDAFPEWQPWSDPYTFDVSTVLTGLAVRAGPSPGATLEVVRESDGVVLVTVTDSDPHDISVPIAAGMTIRFHVTVGWGPIGDGGATAVLTASGNHESVFVAWPLTT